MSDQPADQPTPEPSMNVIPRDARKQLNNPAVAEAVHSAVNEHNETVSVQVDGERRHIAHEQLSLDDGTLVERVS